MRLLEGAAISTIILQFCLAFFLLGVSIYGIYLAFCASIILGIIVLFTPPSSTIVGLVMLFTGKNLAIMLMDFISKNFN
jgi:hypothetical protein